jgi:glycosyltransferase involved in cell wall biosynthesis
MTKEIAHFKADVISASSFPFLHMHYALAGGKRNGSPVVLAGALHPTDSWSFDRPMIYKAINQADAYIAYSKFEQEYLINRGISAKLINVIGAGVDPDQFATANGQELRNAYGWGNDLVIAFVGQLTKRKGVQHLLTAMPQVWASYPQAKLLLAGASSTYSSQLKQEVAKLSNNHNRVVVITDFREAEKAKIFAACDVLVFPSSEESFGIVFLEAWACRKPVIGMRAGAIPSIVTEGLDGLLVTPSNTFELARAICELLANPVRRAEMGQAGYGKMCRQYTWDIVTNKFRDIYSKTLVKS